MVEYLHGSGGYCAPNVDTCPRKTDFEELQAENGSLSVDLDAMVLMCNVLEAENKRLKEYLKLFIEREIDLHDTDDQPYSCDWNLIKEAKQPIMDNVFVKLCELAEITKLPRATLKRLAAEGKIPSLRLSRSLRFNLAAVEKALADLA